MSDSIYYPYRKKEAIDVVSRYFGCTKKKAQEYLEKEAAYRYARQMRTVGELVVSMEVDLKEEAKKAFYED